MWIRQNGLVTDADLAAIAAEVDAEVDEAVAVAEAGTLEPIAELERYTLMEEVPA